MKIGFKTRLWGSRIENIEKALDMVANAGYQGVEFSQRPENLGCNDSDELFKLLSERNLILLSLTCGSLWERLTFLGKHKPSYLSIRYGDIHEIPDLLKKGLVPALHPGVFNPIRRVSDAEALLSEYPGVKFLCDTAHFKIAGDDPAEAVHKLKGNIAAVHLKDWTPEFGRSGPRYARGFTNLGKGVVKPEQTIAQLQKDRFSGWLVAEVENKHQDEGETFLSATNWLSDQGLLPTRSKKMVLVNKTLINYQSVHQSYSADARFKDGMLLAATKEPEHFYPYVAQTIENLTKCDLLTVWSVSPSQEQMALLYSSVPILPNPESRLVIRTREALSGISIERQASITRFNLANENPGAPYGFSSRRLEYAELIQGLLPRQMISIPIYNADYKNYVRMIINIFHRDTDFNMTDDHLYWCGHAVATVSDIMLDKMCSVASTRVNLIAGQSSDLTTFLENLKSLIQKSLSCDGVAIFLVNEGGDKLDLQESTGTSWKVDTNEQFYRKGEGLTGRAWERIEAILTVNSLSERGHKGKSEEAVAASKEHTCLWVPIVNSRGDVLGVIRCRNKKTSQETIVPNMFTDDDASVLDAIGQAAVPHLQILIDKDRRSRALGRLTHELRVPLVAIRGAAELMERTKGSEKFFGHDYIADVWSWSELMRRLLGNADLFRYSPGQIPVQPSLILLMRDVIAPAVKQARILLDERGFSTRNINYGTFEKIPRLWIDRNQFQQVIFNLISNAIKHCFVDPSSFQAEIDGDKTETYYIIRVRDWGPGIAAEMKDAVFEEGVRTSDAIQRNITGQGLGLWVVKEIVKRHGGEVRITSLKQPTEISIFLPVLLSKKSPEVLTERRNK